MLLQKYSEARNYTTNMSYRYSLQIGKGTDSAMSTVKFLPRIPQISTETIDNLRKSARSAGAISRRFIYNTAL